MSEPAMKWRRELRFKYPDLKMTQGEHNVLSCLTEKQHPVSGKCQLSEKEIADETGLHPVHVKRVLKRLCKIGPLSNWKRGTTNHWASEFEFGLGFVFVPLGKPRELGTSRPPLVTSCAATGNILSEPYKERNKGNQNQGNQGNAPHISRVDLALAQRLLEAMPHTVTPTNKNLALASLECEIRTGKTPEEAFQLILAGARETTAAGSLINGFWFSDRKYLHPGGSLSPSAARSQREKEARINALTAYKKQPQAVNE
jgi:hypothetical protein